MSPVVVPIHAKTVTGPKYTGQELYEAWLSTSDNRKGAHRSWSTLDVYRSGRWTALAAIVNERVNSQPYEIEQLIDRFMAGIDERLSRGRTGQGMQEYIDPAYVKPLDPGTSPPPFRNDEDIAKAANDFLLVEKRSAQLETDEMVAELQRRGFGVHPVLGGPKDGPQTNSVSKSEIGNTSSLGHVFSSGGRIPANAFGDTDRFVAENDVAVEGPYSAEPQVNTYAEVKPETKAQVSDPWAIGKALIDDTASHFPRTTPANPQVDTAESEAKTEEKFKDAPGMPFGAPLPALDLVIDGLVEFAKTSLRNALDPDNRADVSQYYLKLANDTLDIIRRELKKPK